MKNIVLIISLLAIFTGCESMYQDDGISRIVTQRDVDAYNATVSSERDLLVCNRERVIGSNIRQFHCMNVAQRDRMQEEAQNASQLIFEANNRVQDPNQ